MAFLSDSELRDLIVQNELVVTGWPDEPYQYLHDDARWADENSPIQPSSLDLHVGEIFVPDKKKGKLGSFNNGHLSYDLRAGESVVVKSAQRIKMPKDVGAIVLPPSRISSKGVLIANFGHIDPGYEGHLRFTLINMGSDIYSIRSGAMVMTMLLFRNKSVHRSFSERYTNRKEKEGPAEEEINALSGDFAQVEKRAEEIAKKALKQEGALGFYWRTVFMPFALGGVVAAVGYLFSAWTVVGELKVRDAAMEAELKNLSSRLETALEDAEEARDQALDLRLKLQRLEEREGN